MFQNTKLSFFLANSELVFDFSPQNQLIALAFLLITVIANLYAISQNRRFESLIGSLYCLSSIACVFAGDFISMTILLEFMTIFSCIIIFYQQLKIKPVRQYFLTHLFSSGIILSGISLLISSTNNTALISLTEATRNFELPAILILAGCLINIGIVFFNGWVVNCYPTTSNSGIIYLISFTTKVALIIVLKLFSGLEILKSLGISMIIYGLVFALIEKNLKKLLCYLTVSQLGFVLAVIAIPHPNVSFFITSFIFIHILYNGLFVLYFSILEDQFGIKNYQDLKNTPFNPILLTGFIIILSIYISAFPINSSIVKEEMANIFNEDYIIIFSKIATCTVLFGLLLEVLYSLTKWISKSSLRAVKDRVVIQKNFTGLLRQLLRNFLAMTNNTALIYLSSCIITLVICLFYPVHIVSSNTTSKVTIFTVLAILALLFRKLPRISTENINFDLYLYIEKFIYYSIDKYKEAITNKEEEEEYFNFKVIWHNALNKLSSWHNQQTSIFIVVVMLISFVLVIDVVPK